MITDKEIEAKDIKRLLLRVYRRYNLELLQRLRLIKRPTY
jgi:hypothetical protein